MRESLCFVAMALAFVLLSTALVGGLAGCAAVNPAIVKIAGSYLQALARLQAITGEDACTLQNSTFHAGPVETRQVGDDAASNYCFFAVDQVAGPAGVPNNIFLEGTYEQDGGHVTATVGEGGAGTTSTAQAGPSMTIDLQARGDTLTGTGALTINGVTYSGDLSLEYTE